MSSETGPRLRRGDPFQSAAGPPRNPKPDLGPRPPAHLPKLEPFLQQLRGDGLTTFHWGGARLLLRGNRFRGSRQRTPGATRPARGNRGTEARCGGGVQAGGRPWPGTGHAGLLGTPSSPRPNVPWDVTAEGQRAGRRRREGQVWPRTTVSGKRAFSRERLRCDSRVFLLLKLSSFERTLSVRFACTRVSRLCTFCFPPDSGNVGRDWRVARGGREGTAWQTQSRDESSF